MNKYIVAIFIIIFSVGMASAGEHRSHFLNAVSMAAHGAQGISSLSGMGDALPGVYESQADSTNFTNGQKNFSQVETLNPANATSGPPGQLGPLFNNTSCAACHSNPARGGGGLTLAEQRLSTGGPPVRIFAVDNMLMSGSYDQNGVGTIFSYGAIAPVLGGPIGLPSNRPSRCQKVEMARGFSPSLPICIPGSSNDSGLIGAPSCVAHRESLPLFGDGLVEATSDQTFTQLAASERDNVRGVVRMISDINNFNGLADEVNSSTRDALSTPHVARFGWKDDFSTLLGFSGDAYLNEIGITNDLNSNPNTDCAMGVIRYEITLQSQDDPEDTLDSTGKSDLDRFTDFMRSLAPPPQLPQTPSSIAGSTIFNQIGCASCHTPTLTTADNPQIVSSINGSPVTNSLRKTLSNVTYHPYGDFLLHDMGSLGDGVNDDPTILHDERLMRTMPLWGLRAREVFLHDGRATDLPSAITLHDGQGAAAAKAFKGLSGNDQQHLIDFLNTL